MVEWKKIGEVCELVRGNGVQKTDFTEEGVGCIHYGQIYTHYGPYTYTTNRFVSEETAQKARLASSGDVIMTSTSENVEDICKSVAYLGEKDIAVSAHAIILKHQMNPKYLSFCTTTNDFYKQKAKLARGAKVVEIKPELVSQILIPIPSLSEQQRIVGILDTFTASIGNLKEQIAQRRKQYEYYRDQLLDLEGKPGVEMKPLDSIAEIGTGSSNTQDELEFGKYPFFVRSQIVRWKDEYEFDETAVITSGDGVGVGKVLHYYEGKYALHQRAYRIHVIVKDFVPKFLFYFMQKDFYDYIMSNAYAASVTSVRKPMLLKYPIPVPPLAEQQRIVGILDTFEASIQNLEEQLKEREKQYEYYRNKLLTFE